MKLSAIILAGGMSRRMGMNKALLPYRGKPLIQFSIDLALKFTEHILISSGQEELKKYGFPLVADILGISAPLTGVHAGLKASKSDWNLVLTCDMPNVTEELIRYLARYAGSDSKLVLPGHYGYVEPLCGFYHRNLIPVIEKNFLNGRYRPLDLLETEQHHVLPVEGIFNEDSSFLFRNVNEKRDLL